MSEIKANTPPPLDTVLNGVDLPTWQVFAKDPKKENQTSRPSHQPATVERNLVPAVVPNRLLSSPQRCQMSGGDEGRGPAAWTAKKQRWYADLVVQCMAPKKSRAAINFNVPAVLGQLDEMPLDACVLMRGKRTLDGRCKDSAQVMWSHDRHGRWFARIDGEMVWLGRKLARLRYGRAHIPSELEASHNCGNCDCTRWQHVRFQPRSEDVLDREHHQRYPNTLRAEVRALLVHPIAPTPPQGTNTSKASEKPISRDLPRALVISRDLPRPLSISDEPLSISK